MGIINDFFCKESELSVLIKWIEGLGGAVTCRETFAARGARYGSLDQISPRLTAALRERGVERLYSHQSEAAHCAMAGHDVVVVTPTASGKTLCYNVPVADALLADSNTRALYIFPTKALARDQLTELEELSQALGGLIKAHVYDGDTPQQTRAKARAEANVLITNPDMLNTAILPHHTRWAHFFRSLKYIVIDELHSYRGIFGSHMANLLSRLERICAFYGASPSFICCSATIANPGEHAEALAGRGFQVVSENGAPAPQREFLIYNPPFVDKGAGARRSSLFETARISAHALAAGVSTIIFTRTRTGVELLLKYLRRELSRRGLDPDMVTGYRGGYLPRERRAIEQALRDGRLRGVISTNALELGMDIGSLDLAVLNGYPGSVASTWQQIGRAGRRGSSLAVLVASALPVDQFIASKPRWLLSAQPELARIDPRNPYIRVAHVKCAAFELSFAEGGHFGGEDIAQILEYLSRHGVLHKGGGEKGAAYYWQDDSYPAAELSMRSATGDVYAITDVSGGRPRVIGTMDRHSAPTLLFPGAVYFHGGESYLVRELDGVEMRCLVQKGETDYYTVGESTVRIAVDEEFEREGLFGWGEVTLSSTPSFFKKIKLSTHEHLGTEEICLPEEQMATTACWITLPRESAGRSWAEAAEGSVNIIRNAAPLSLMCEGGDLRVILRQSAPGVEGAAIFVADNVPGGVGLAEGVYELKEKLLLACAGAIELCGCRGGCPACVGARSSGVDLKEAVKKLIAEIVGG